MDQAEIEVTEAVEANDELVDAFALLIPQLSSSSPPPGRADLEAMIASPATVVLLARLPASEGGTIVGTLTLALFRIPTALRAWIEDVVVDGSARGRGAGEALTLAAVERARGAGARTVDLTSRPSRESANRLYRRLGFALRDTNIYRLELPA